MADLQNPSTSKATESTAEASPEGEFQENNNNNVILEASDSTPGEGAPPDVVIPILRPEQVWSEEELDRDPHRMCFYDAYRSAATPESDDEEEPASGAAKPLNLTDDWDMWDYMSMDEETLRQRLQHHPLLLEQITRKRKRRAEAALEGANPQEDDELCTVMERHAKVTKFNEHTTVC